MRILLSADWQLGKRQYGLHERYLDYLKAATTIAQLAVEHKADVLIVAGDIFDMPRPPGDAVEAFRQAVRIALDGGVKKVLCLEGNHDLCGESWIRLCDATPLQQEPFLSMDGVMVVGLNFLRHAPLKQAVQELADKFAASAPARPDVVVLHCSPSEMIGWQNPDDVSVAWLASVLGPVGTRMVLMGDIHDAKYVEESGIIFMQPGSPEMTARNEMPAKQCSLIEIANEGPPKVTTIPLVTRPFLQVRVSSTQDVLDLVTQTAGGTGMVPVVLVELDPANTEALASFRANRGNIRGLVQLIERDLTVLSATGDAAATPDDCDSLEVLKKLLMDDLGPELAQVATGLLRAAAVGQKDVMAHVVRLAKDRGIQIKDVVL